MSATASDRPISRWGLRTATMALALQTAMSVALAGDVPPTASRPVIDRGIEAYWNADYEKARTELDSVAESALAPEERVLLHKFQSLCAFAQRRDAEAMRQLELILASDPTYRLGADEVAPPVKDAFDQTLDRLLKDAYAQGKTLYVAGRKREAAAFFETATKLDPADEYARAFLHLATMESDRPR